MNKNSCGSYFLPLTLSSVILSIGIQNNAFARDPQKSKDDKPLNVLFFFVDDLRPNLGCYGDRIAITPNIDKLSHDGLVFTRAYCQQGVSNPSRTSVLTGLRPDEAGVTDLETHFRDKVPDVTTLPQLFKNNGYLTLGTGKVYHSTPFIIDNPSWTRPVPPYELRGYLLSENQVGTGKQNVTEAADVADIDYPDGVTANTAIMYLKEAKADDKPFFIAVGFTKPHAPFVAPKRYWDKYKDTEFVISDRERPVRSPDMAFHNWEELRMFRDIPKSGPLTKKKEREIWNGYYACISYMDAQVGRIMEIVDQLGLRENTIIVLWGDNGYHLGEQDLWCKSTNFELDTHIPLIIAAPSMKGNGKKCNAIVESLDIYPTLIELCNLKPQSKLSGISLYPLLDNPDKRWKNIAFNQFIRPYSALRKGNPSHMGYSIRTDEWRCTCWWDLVTGKIVEKELYNMKDSMIEKENLAGDIRYTKTEAALTAKIIAYKNKSYSE